MAESGSDLQEVSPPPMSFEERMKAKKEAEERGEKIEIERLTNDYLERTGREEMKP